MSASTTHSLSQDKFLTLAANLLYKAFLGNSRTQAKNVYKELAQGKTACLTTVQMEDKSTVRFDIALDHSEYRGTINFGAFRSSVTLLISSLSESLKEAEKIPVFSAHGDSNVMIFGVTAVTREAENANVMVLGADMAADRPSVLLKLMYLDHEQFEVDTEASA
jgi:hypothetical protein